MTSYDARTPGDPFDTLGHAGAANSDEFIREGSAEVEVIEGTSRRRVSILGWLDDNVGVYGVRRGGMGVVYLCALLTPGAPIAAAVALKSYLNDLMLHPTARDGFVRECKLWMKLPEKVDQV